MLGSLSELVIILFKQKEKKLWKLMMDKVLLIISNINRMKIQCFFYSVQVNQDNRIANFSWRDGRSKLDYDSFRDVIFDTTYQTKKYNLICAPFVGINHHWNNVLFGCAFLTDETTQSFI